MEKMFSNHELSSYTGVPCISYKKLFKMDHLTLPVIILYEVNKNYGHWTCVFKNKDAKGNDVIEFFDSMGQIPDDHNQMLDLGYYPQLLYLMDKKKPPIVYNEIGLQKKDFNINTCGRWVLARLWLSDMPLEEFQKIFDREDSDMFVTNFTDSVIRNIFN